jgi:hypothetical protein
MTTAHTASTSTKAAGRSAITLAMLAARDARGYGRHSYGETHLAMGAALPMASALREPRRVAA